jgi:L-alanine-DL-glutamate epimerase-like enolase superfamily enzyme
MPAGSRLLADDPVAAPHLVAPAAGDRDPHATVGPPVASVRATAYTVPTRTPESDGTLEWENTTIVIVEVRAGDAEGIGYAYTAAAAAQVVRDTLAEVVVGKDALAPAVAWIAMVRAIRNLGRPGVVASAIAAVDIALWDLRAKLLGLSPVSNTNMTLPPLCRV